MLETGTVSFDYSNNNGRYTIGSGMYLFETHWSKASGTSIYVLNDPHSIQGVALALDVSLVTDITNASIYDMSSRHRTPQEGEFVVLKNNNDYYAVLEIVDIKDRTRSDSQDELTFKYYIQTNKSFNFSQWTASSNVSPTDIILDNKSITDNDAGAVVGNLSVTDADTNDTHTLSLSGSHGWIFEVSNNQLKLRSGVIADYETQSSYSVTVTATDSGGLSKNQDFTITVSNQNSAPTAITLDSTTVAENSVGSHIANISGVDPDEDDLTYSITGGSDAASFEIVNGMLHLAAGVSADYETQSSYSVTLTATDLGGLTYNEDFTINITDVEEASTLYGSKSNDTLDGFSGYDIIDGGDGLDTAKYSVASSEVSFSKNDAGQLVIQNSFIGLPTVMYEVGWLTARDTLISMERIQFSDKNYALDLDGNAGVAAKAIIASFGADSISAYMSAALSVVDSGTSMESLCDLVVDLKLIDQLTGSSSNSSFVGHLFKNVVGRSPNLLENALYTNQLENGTHTKSSLLVFAANTTRTEALVTANSVDLIGVPGSADGEILALQYDLGLG